MRFDNDEGEAGIIGSCELDVIVTRVRWVNMGKQWKTLCHKRARYSGCRPSQGRFSVKVLSTMGIPPWRRHGIVVKLQGSIPRRSPSETGSGRAKKIWQEFIKVPYYVCRKANRLVSTGNNDLG